MNISWSATAEERIADGNIRRGDGRQESRTDGAAADKVRFV